MLPTAKYLYSLKAMEVDSYKSYLSPTSFVGNFRSLFKGQGLEFNQVRQYHFGDEIKNIDWRVTARTGKTHIREYLEEKENEVTIISNVGKEMYFSSISEKLKYFVMAEIVSLLSFSAEKNKDNLQLFFYGSNLKKMIFFRSHNKKSQIMNVLGFLSQKKRFFKKRKK